LPKYSKNTPVSVLPLFGRFAAGSFMATGSSGVGFMSDGPMNVRTSTNSCVGSAQSALFRGGRTITNH
jgi:hypothetical protein